MQVTFYTYHFTGFTFADEDEEDGDEDGDEMHQLHLIEITYGLTLHKAEKEK